MSILSVNTGRIFNPRSIIVHVILFSLLNSPTASTAPSRNLLEEIIVTATKRDDVRAQDVGISLSAITEESMERHGYDDFAEFATSIAGLSFGQRGPGQSLVILRGVNSSSTQFNTDEPESKETVSIYFDETPVSLNGFHPDPRLFDMNRIEVLRGPQGTLYGSGSLSGTIRYISNAPDVNQFDSKFATTYSNTKKGSHNYEVNGMVNIPLIDGTAALRVTGYGRFVDGFVDNLAPQNDPRHPFFGASGLHNLDSFKNVNTDDTWGGRIQLSYEPTDRFKATARLYHQSSELGGYPTEDTFAVNEPLPGNDPNNALLGDFQQSRLLAEASDDEFSLYNLDLHLDLGFARLVSVTSFLDRDMVQDFEFSDIIPFLLGIPVTRFPAPAILNNVTNVEDIIQEVRLVSQTNWAFDWVLGAFFDAQEKQFLQSAPVFDLTDTLATFGLPRLSTLFGSPAPGLADNIFESRSTFDETQIAIFGEAGWDITEQLRLIAGFRWFDFDQDFFFGDTQGAFASGLSINNNLSEDGINPKFSLEFRPNEDWLVYGTAAKGFRLGGNNDPIPTQLCGIANSDLAFDSDSLWNFELGAKATLQDRIQVNGAVYYIEWSDIPVADSLPCGFAVTRNVGEVEVIGFEGDIRFTVSENFQINGSLSYTDSEFVQDFAPLNIVDGTETPLVPEWTFSANAVYYFPVNFGGLNMEGYISGNYSHQDDRYNTPNPMERVLMDSYNLASFRIGLVTDRWQASLFVDNAFDERAVIFKDTIFLIENRDTVNRPRTFGFNLIANF